MPIRVRPSGVQRKTTGAAKHCRYGGGNGYALEYRISRVLCDARILNVFEGAAEIQANIVIKGLLAL